MADLVKNKDLEFAAQLNTFKGKIGNYSILFGLTPEQLSSISDDAAWMNFVAQCNEGVPGYAQNWTRLKNQLRFGGDGASVPPFPMPPDVSMPPTPVVVAPNVEGRFRTLVSQIKVNSNYSKAIGEDLGIHIADTSFDPENYKPKGTAKAVLNVVTIKFVKVGVDGMAIYSRVLAAKAAARAAATDGTNTSAPVAAEGINEFKKIDVDYRSPYVDNRPLAVAGQAETREYYLRGILKDVEIGVPSDVIKVVVGG